MRITLATIVLMACTSSLASAQTPTIDHWTPAQIMAKAAELEPKAHGPDGAASTKLTEYPNHYTMVALRNKNGGAEIHDDYADFFYVVKGHGTLVNKGDVVHIPAGVSHQLLISAGSTFVYFVIKVKEK